VISICRLRVESIECVLFVRGDPAPSPLMPRCRPRGAPGGAGCNAGRQ
jgi:hypothetical protein